jgi:hypothetical protein
MNDHLALRHNFELPHQAHHSGDIDEVRDVADLKRLGASTAAAICGRAAFLAQSI